jgi:KDO2-lipid IV(A) lauroyltransferase
MFSYISYAFSWAFSFLPFWFLYLLSDIGYFLVYHLFRYRRGVVRANLRNAFPGKDPAEIRRVERAFYRHLADLPVEFYKLWHMSEAVARERFTIKNPELPARYLDEGRDILVILGHYGNWEWLSSYGLYTPARFLVLYKPLHDKTSDRLMKRLRSHFRAVPVPKNNMVREITRCRSEGKRFMLCLVADQTPHGSSLDYWTTFLEQETPVFRGPEKIACKYDMPVLFLKMRKVRRGRYEAEYLPVCDHPAGLPPGELTRRHVRVLEEIIRERPEYWLWSHRRWKHERPLDAPLNT